MEGIITVDLHGKNEYQARVALDAQLRRVKAGTYRLRVIHGYHSGTALREIVRRDYKDRVLGIKVIDEGTTDLILREF